MSTHRLSLLYAIKNQIGFIKLNRAEALNALAPTMMASLRQRLTVWRDMPDVQAVVVISNSDKAFCAGGDLKAVYKNATTHQFDMLETLFREEYSLTHLIKTFPKPFISFVDGIVMGGGLGLCIHGSHRLFSERVIAAMPETNIGFFPDVGATHFLNQAPGKVGLYLGLLGIQMSCADALYAKWGTHFVMHADQRAALEALKGLKRKTPGAIDDVIAGYAKPLPRSSLADKEQEINDLFEAETLLDIFKNLEKSASAFAQETLEALKQRSPTSLAVTFEQLKRGRTFKDFAEVMSFEFALSQNFVRQHDFIEGIRAAVVDKDKKPMWSPSTLAAISSSDVAAYFTAPPAPLFSSKPLKHTA